MRSNDVADIIGTKLAAIHPRVYRQKHLLSVSSLTLCTALNLSVILIHLKSYTST